jgi:hypothetical protein
MRGGQLASLHRIGSEFFIHTRSMEHAVLLHESLLANDLEIKPG